MFEYFKGLIYLFAGTYLFSSFFQSFGIFERFLFLPYSEELLVAGYVEIIIFIVVFLLWTIKDSIKHIKKTKSHHPILLILIGLGILSLISVTFVLFLERIFQYSGIIALVIFLFFTGTKLLPIIRNHKKFKEEYFDEGISIFVWILILLISTYLSIVLAAIILGLIHKWLGIKFNSNKSTHKIRDNVFAFISLAIALVILFAINIVLAILLSYLGLYIPGTAFLEIPANFLLALSSDDSFLFVTGTVAIWHIINGLKILIE